MTSRIAASQAPLSVEFSRQEYWREFPSSRDLPDQGIKPRSPALCADSLLSEPPGKPHSKWLAQMSFSRWALPWFTQTRERNLSSVLQYFYKTSILTPNILYHSYVYKDFPCGSAGKESAYNLGDLGSISGLVRSPGEGKGYSFKYSGLENSMDCIVHGVQRVRHDWATFTFFCLYLLDMNLDYLLFDPCLLHFCSPSHFTWFLRLS